MGFAKCFDVVTMVTDEATEQFGSLLCEDKNKKEALKVYCGMIDSLAERFDGVSFEVEVDDEMTDITVALVCGEFEIDDCSDDFYKLVEAAKKVSFKAMDDDTIQVNFKFGGIWVKVS